MGEEWRDGDLADPGAGGGRQGHGIGDHYFGQGAAINLDRRVTSQETVGDHGADRFRTGVVNGACHVAERAAGEDDVVHDDAIPPGDGSKKGGDLAGLILRGADLVADGNPGTEVGKTTHVIPGEFGTAGIGGDET